MRRYQREHPGELIHIDIKKLARFDRVGHRITGERTVTGAWATASARAIGYQLAAMKRPAQALEARLLVDRLLDADSRALIAVCGDLNATEIEVPTRIQSCSAIDTENPLLESRALVPLAEAVPVAGGSA